MGLRCGRGCVHVLLYIYYYTMHAGNDIDENRTQCITMTNDGNGIGMTKYPI